MHISTISRFGIILQSGTLMNSAKGQHQSRRAELAKRRRNIENGSSRSAVVSNRRRRPHNEKPRLGRAFVIRINAGATRAEVSLSAQAATGLSAKRHFSAGGPC